MKTYEIPTLNDKTPEGDRNKLISAFKGVAGVANATLNLASHKVEISAKDQKDPKRDEIVAAAAKAGFQISNPTK